MNGQLTFGKRSAFNVQRSVQVVILSKAKNLRSEMFHFAQHDRMAVDW
jgi:hypothetical protein